MSKQPAGPSAGELAFAGAFDSAKESNVRSAEGVSGGHGGTGEANEAMMSGIGTKSLPTIGGPGMDSCVKLGGSMGELFSYFTAAGGALGASIADCFGKMMNYFGTDEAKGDTIAMDNIGPGEITSHGIVGVQGDLQIAGKGASFRSQQPAGQEH